MDYETAVEKVATLIQKEIEKLLEDEQKDEAHALHQAKTIVMKALHAYIEMYTAFQMFRSVLSKLS